MLASSVASSFAVGVVSWLLLETGIVKSNATMVEIFPGVAESLGSVAVVGSASVSVVSVSVVSVSSATATGAVVPSCRSSPFAMTVSQNV